MKRKFKTGIIFLLLFSLVLVLSSCAFPFYFIRYNVSGNVTDNQGNPISQVAIKFSNGFDTVYTNSAGQWQKTGLGGTVTISASKVGYNFSPSEYVVDDTEDNINFVIDETIEQPYNISGVITDSEGGGIEDVIIRFGGEYNPVETNTEGFWEKEGITGEVTATPEKDGYQFDPESRTVSSENSYLNFIGTIIN